MNRDTDTLGQRLKTARKKRRLTQDELADLAGLKQTDISKLETGRIRETVAIARLAHVLNVPALWLELNAGEAPNWENAQHVSEGSASHRLAQELSHPLRMIDPPTLPWETVLKPSPLPPRFMLTVPDASMTCGDASSLEPGDMAIFETNRAPMAGRNVLVRDAIGAVYIREYRVRNAQAWTAVAKHSGFAPLESERDGLVILAVQVGHLY